MNSNDILDKAASDYAHTYEDKHIVKEAYIAGAQAFGITWHNLQRDPNDLPNRDMLVLDEAGDKVKYYTGTNKFVYIDSTIVDKVIAWCEVPKFKREV